jgi:hypothetical protein
VEKESFTMPVRAFLVGLLLGAGTTAIVGVAATGAGRGSGDSEFEAGFVQRSADDGRSESDRALLSGLEKRRNDNDRVLRGAVERIQNAIDENDRPIQQIGATLSAVSDFLGHFNNWLDNNNDIADSFHNYLVDR